uniref:Uncharacterized protein n=1 Tax=Oryza sativa subsp. japonica TaxID=39947 RepID=Q6K4C5_ORYSJ|nr:hypothetical protein [Oryza sativa Japonica Group]BAD34330.1 hypothetical protein [Oryza sativa Japonica Group]
MEAAVRIQVDGWCGPSCSRWQGRRRCWAKGQHQWSVAELLLHQLVLQGATASRDLGTALTTGAEATNAARPSALPLGHVAPEQRKSEWKVSGMGRLLECEFCSKLLNFDLESEMERLFEML